jgi:altronate dehydratase
MTEELRMSESERPVVIRTAPRAPIPLAKAAVVLDDRDTIAIAKEMLVPGTELVDNTWHLRIAQAIPTGHKVALRPIRSGEAVLRYGQIIGFATTDIEAGTHVHTHNLSVGEEKARVDYAVGADFAPVELAPDSERRDFMGFRRPDGRIGTRNYVAVLASVNCSSSATRRVVETIRTSGVLAEFPNVDDVIALTTKGGCGSHYGSSGWAQLQRTLAGVVDHPNVAAYVILSLGCEDNQPSDMIRNTGLDRTRSEQHVLTIQQTGGFDTTIAAAADAVRELLPVSDAAERVRVPASELVVALQCGGSDGWSGVTANPAVGRAADLVVQQGGTVVLGETPEIYGGEHLLTRRAKTPQVAEKLLARIHWWEQYTAMFGATIDNNPAPGNKAGGLTTIYEKSLGAIAKSGSTPLNDVLEYAERVSERGFVHMDTPGYDPVSVTGQVAGGCNLVVFTTGRGSCFGFKPSPSVKVASNSALFASQPADMDIDAGRILDGATVDEIGAEIFEEILAVASGKPTKSELADIGEEEFNPWIVGVTL